MSVSTIHPHRTHSKKEGGLMSLNQQTTGQSFNRALICAIAGWTGAHEAFANKTSLCLLRYCIAMLLGPICLHFDNFIPIAVLIAFCSFESIVILHGNRSDVTTSIWQRLIIYLLAACGCFLAYSITIVTLNPSALHS